MNLVLVTPPAAQPIDWAMAKSHLRVDADDEKTRVEGVLIPAASGWCETFTQRAFITQTWRLYLDHFPGRHHPGCEEAACLAGFRRDGFNRMDLWPPDPRSLRPVEIPKPPLRSITSIKYIDQDGVEQTWTDYVVSPPIQTVAPGSVPVFDPCGQPSRIRHAYGKMWPVTRAQHDAICIEFVCGYGDTADAVPADLRSAMLLVIGEQFERRELSMEGRFSTATRTAERVAWPYRVNILAGGD